MNKEFFFLMFFCFIFQLGLSQIWSDYKFFLDVNEVSYSSIINHPNAVALASLEQENNRLFPLSKPWTWADFTYDEFRITYGMLGWLGLLNSSAPDTRFKSDEILYSLPLESTDYPMYKLDALINGEQLFIVEFKNFVVKGFETDTINAQIIVNLDNSVFSMHFGSCKFNNWTNYKKSSRFLLVRSTNPSKAEAKTFLWFGDDYYNLKDTVYQGVDTNLHILTSPPFDDLKLSFSYSQSMSSYNSSYLSTTIDLFPNPANDFIQISNFEEIGHINIFDLSGRFIDSSTLTGGILNVENLSSGIYLLECTFKNGSKEFKKFIKL